jgi:quercetin dioxygenase-like cupin family protein
MTGIQIDAVVIPGDHAERVDYPADTIWLRAVGHGDIQVADYTSTDRDGPPAHSHPWDEVQIVVDGEVEFLVGETWHGGGSGTVQLLPHGVPHSVRVPAGTARILQVSIGPPYDGFARDMARLFAAGAPLTEIVEAAGRHGVRLG